MSGTTPSERYIIFDIETSRMQLDCFDSAQAEYLFRGATTDEEKQEKEKLMSLSPLTSYAVCIGIMVMDVNKEGEESIVRRGAVVMDESMPQGEVQLVQTAESRIGRCTEKTLIQRFWTLLEENPEAHLVTFNGRNFDCPFLMLRSALLKVRPPRNLMQGTKFNYSRHTDLLDELTFFSPQSSGATRRFNFDFYARAFGIESPKAAGVDGSKVFDYFEEGKLEEIAEYCLRDVDATWELFKVWSSYLRY